MDIILLIVVLTIVSSLTRSLKKPVERGTRNPMQSVSSDQRQPMRAQPSVPGSEAEPNLMGGPLGSFLQRLSGEDQAVQNQRLARSREERLYKERQLEEQLRIKRESEEKASAEALQWANEMEDSSEISDLPELQDFITDEQLLLEDTQMGVAAEWNLAEAQKGIIWNEILENPRFKTAAPRNHH